MQTAVFDGFEIYMTMKLVLDKANQYGKKFYHICYEHGILG